MFETLWHRYLRVPYTLHVYRVSSAPKPRATLVFLHGIGNSGRTWDDVSMHVPDDVNIVIVDLLGFGDSPRPDWAAYDAGTQARSLAKTLLQLGVRQKVTLVGHSMGSLVAVEFTKRYPALVSSLVLCSPPIYNLDIKEDKKLFFERDFQLRRIYEIALKDPKNIVKLSRIAKKYGFMNEGFDPEGLSVTTYTAALRANILNQTTLHDIARIKKPVRILYGLLDPFVIGDNIKKAKAASEYVQVNKFIGGHEIIGGYVKRVAGEINAAIGEDKE